jgi:hypothetical protein
MRLTLSILLLAFAASALAGGPVYRYKDKDGVVHYTDKPPTPDAEPASLPPLQTISPSEPLSEVTGGAPAADKAAAPAITLKVTAPAADEVFRGDDRLLTVSASSDRPLPDGVGLLYLLDGAAQNNTPVKGMSFTMQNVERGEHSVSVTAVDPSGKELGRSAPVTVHMMPPTIQNAPKIPKPPTK